MREEFIEYFDGIEARLRKQKVGLWLVNIIDEAQESPFAQLPLRSDGFVFLYFNVYQMVVLPWENSKKKRDFGQSPDEIYMVSQDIRNILSDAASQSELNDRKEISANAILQSLAALDDKLLTRAQEFWGP